MPSELPLGIFDSGVGGLTVVHAARQLLPNESIIYLGDTARLPYGNKSPETVHRFTRQICNFLLGKNVKAIVIACNTASAHTLPSLQKEIPVPIFGVLRPGVESALGATKSGRIGIIGTMGTIRSMAYQKALLEQREDLHLIAKPTPLLVPLVEENYLEHPAARLIVQDYLKDIQKEEIDTLVLACTHYPLLKPLIQDILGDKIVLVDSSTACARNLREHLKAIDRLNTSSNPSSTEIFLTDLSLHFTNIAKRFLQDDVTSIQVVSL